jgi:hypothetical protein
MDLSPSAIAGDQRLDRFVDPLSRFADRVLARDDVRGALAGDWLGHPLHPALTDLPIGFWTSAFALDLGGNRCRRAADLMVAAGLLSVLPTAATGIADWRHRDRGGRRLGVVHAAGNVVASALYALSLGHRMRGHRLRGVGFGVAGASAATAAAYLGGHLAFGDTGSGTASADGVEASVPDAESAEIVDPQGAALRAVSRPA